MLGNQGVSVNTRWGKLSNKELPNRMTCHCGSAGRLCACSPRAASQRLRQGTRGSEGWDSRLAVTPPPVGGLGDAPASAPVPSARASRASGPQHDSEEVIPHHVCIAIHVNSSGSCDWLTVSPAACCSFTDLPHLEVSLHIRTAISVLQ